jgi:hypothetical protein
MNRLICMAVLNQGLMAFREVGGAKESGGQNSVAVRGPRGRDPYRFRQVLSPFISR